MYQVLYRKWRPKVFADVVGQPHVTQTLLNEVKNNRLSHAYLFTGSRGTGKTTCAKILAKAMNCLHPVDGDPCNECEICRGIEDGSILDIVEIDAASNNGVDNIRDLREEANFTPVSAKFRVYIIDEVHMLSIGAFNALLKTLEEPPAHVKFILATTEIHKLPATILSRCQRFDFRRIPPEDMAARMQYIAGQEGWTLEPDAALLIARLADGALRDALSILDQCGGQNKTITTEIVSSAAGLTGREYLYELSRAIGAKNTAAALNILDRLHQSSCDMERLGTELVNHFRNLLVVKTVNEPGNLIVSTAEELEQMRACAASFTLEETQFILDTLGSALSRMRGGGNRRIEMEMTVVKLCDSTLCTGTSALLERISLLEKALKSGSLKPVPEPAAPPQPAPVPPAATSVSSLARPEVKERPVMEETPPPPIEEELRPPEPAGSTPVPAASPIQEETPPGTDGGDVPFSQWPQVLDEIMRLDMPLFGILANSSAFVRGPFLLIDSPNPTVKEFIKIKSHATAVLQALLNVTGTRYKLGLYHRAAAEPSAPQRDALELLLQQAQEAGVDVKIDD